jgi:gamma-glutamyltranspeptidase/glutathione hydrolase/leukotriene-C4 hydrolase
MILKRQTAFLKFLAILVVLILIAVVLSAVIILNRNWYNSVSNKPNTNNAIVTCGVECAGIGKDIMNRGGSVADSAVAVLICEGIICPQVCNYHRF